MTAYYVYRIFDQADRLIYVGCTKDLCIRLRQHRASTSAWTSQAARVVAKVYRSRGQALAVESEAIRTELPLYNLRDKWSHD